MSLKGHLVRRHMFRTFLNGIFGSKGNVLFSRMRADVFINLTTEDYLSPQYFAYCMWDVKFPCHCIKRMRDCLSFGVNSQVQADVRAHNLCERKLTPGVCLRDVSLQRLLEPNDSNLRIGRFDIARISRARRAPAGLWSLHRTRRKLLKTYFYIYNIFCHITHTHYVCAGQPSAGKATFFI